ncbi:MAG TPA: flavodoxin family protein [Ferrovibrio sp.]|jgi:multimeric flavodoxin WrbA|uniref:flavodoxin family protein n=1 Tax=Ferrovibrio sp. TaxID=1917215 RepID=UPI002ED5B66D
MTKVAVVYHSGYGHTQKQAEAVAKGAQAVAGVQVALIPVAEAQARVEEITAADAIVFGAPTYMGSVSGPFKTWMDTTSKVWGQWNGKLAAGFTNSASQSGDKLNSLLQLAIFAAQHGMVWVSLGLMPGNNNSKGSVNDLNRLGSFLGAMAQSNADEGPDKGPIASDLLTAEHLGKRVATLARQHAAAARELVEA